MPCSVCKTVPDAFLVIVASVTTSPTNAPVMPPSIGAVTPELNAVATVAPAPVAREVIPAFFSVVQEARQQVARTTNQTPSPRPR